MNIYKLDFYFDKDYTNLNQIIQGLHNYKIKYFISFNGFSFNKELLIYTNHNLEDILDLYEGYSFSKIKINKLNMDIYEKPIICLKYNFTPSNRSNIKNYIKKNKDILDQSDRYNDFIKNMNYTSPKEIHEQIFQNYKKYKNLEDIIFYTQKHFKQKNENQEFIHLTSNSTKQFFKIFLKMEVSDKSLEDLLQKSNSYGIFTYKNYNK